MTKVRYDVKKNEIQRGKKLTRGIGINDADYGVFQRLPEGGAWHCPIYRAWSNMLTRVTTPDDGKYYYDSNTAHYNSYKSVSICRDWIYFSKFREWMLTQDWEGKALDKDLIGDGGVYSPEACCFIPPYINSLLIQGRNKRNINDYMVGVSGKTKKGFDVAVKYLGNWIRGTFKTELEAHQFWQEHKAKAFREVGKLALDKGDINQEIYQHLLNKADKLDYCRLNNISTVKI